MNMGFEMDGFDALLKFCFFFTCAFRSVVILVSLRICQV